MVDSRSNEEEQTSQENEKLARKMIDDVWNRGRAELLEELVTPDYVRRDSALP